MFDTERHLEHLLGAGTGKISACPARMASRRLPAGTTKAGQLRCAAALLRRGLPRHGIVEELYRLAYEAFNKPVPKMPGLDELLAWLDEHHIPMAVASSSP